jgi:hypothetical protein
VFEPGRGPPTTTRSRSPQAALQPLPCGSAGSTPLAPRVSSAPALGAAATAYRCSPPASSGAGMPTSTTPRGQRPSDHRRLAQAGARLGRAAGRTSTSMACAPILPRSPLQRVRRSNTLGLTVHGQRGTRRSNLCALLRRAAGTMPRPPPGAPIHSGSCGGDGCSVRHVGWQWGRATWVGAAAKRSAAWWAFRCPASRHNVAHGQVPRRLHRGKMGATGRTDAVAKAMRLGLA